MLVRKGSVFGYNLGMLIHVKVQATVFDEKGSGRNRVIGENGGLAKVHRAIEAFEAALREVDARVRFDFVYDVVPKTKRPGT